MSKIKITELKENKYNPEIREGPLMMCDILGFSNHTKTTDISTIKQEIINILRNLDDISEKDIGRTLFEGQEFLQPRLGDWPSKLNLKSMFFSDTIFLYPDPEIKFTFDNAQLILPFFSLVASVIVKKIITEHHWLIRGAITFDEYGVIKTPPTIFGKGIVDLYELEQKQNWGGFLLSPYACYIMGRSPVLESGFVEYPVPIKKKNREAFDAECKEYRINPRVLNWPKYVDIVEWDKIYSNLDVIKDLKARNEAKIKIDNTKKFYDHIRQNM